MAAGALMRIRYLPPGRGVPSVALADLLARPELAARFAGKVVFAGVTAPSLPTASSRPMPAGRPSRESGFHADAFETMAQRTVSAGRASLVWTFLFSLALAVAAGLAFGTCRVGGLTLGGAGGAGNAHMVTPYFFFTHGAGVFAS